MAQRIESQENLVKVVIIGDSAVGKTNIILRFVNQNYKLNHLATIGVDFKVKTLTIGDSKLKMQIWDTAGQERFKTLTQTYYKNAVGIILVYSVTDRKSFESMQGWIKQINNHHGQDTVVRIIVANKIDTSQNQRQVQKSQGQQLADKYKIPFRQVSAKDNINIQNTFLALGKQILQSFKYQPQIKKRTTLSLEQKVAKSTKSSSKCC